jgi:hypothetical protein
VTGLPQARAATEARKRAVYAGTLDAAINGERGSVDVVRGLMSGFDIGQRELADTLLPLETACAMSIADGSDPVTLVSGAFLDGLLVGLFLAQARSRETTTAAT